MLSIGKLGAGQERYYLEQVAQGAEDYYSGEGEAEGQWLGEAAEDLGLSGSVEADQLTAMLTGHNPATGEPLGLRAVGGRGAVPGFDLTFSVPKSASLLWALGDQGTSAEVIAALEVSTKAALDYLEREACWTRRGADAEFVKGNGFLSAGFRHRTSRSGDPQLHLHALIANATRGPDGKWTRLHHPSIYEHAKTAGYLFEAQFRHELTQRLGVRWKEVRNGIAEIQGFKDEHLRSFSTRRRQILEAAGPEASARSRQIANLTTRTAKEGASEQTLWQRWRDKAEEVGLSMSRIELGFAHGRPVASRPAPHRLVGRAVTAGASHFDRRAVVQAVAELAASGALAAEVERQADAFLSSEEVIHLGSGPKGERFTTREVWETEREALAAVERLKASGPSPAGELAAERTLISRPTLKTDQEAMVRRLLTERSGIAVVIGEAGAGKTYAIVAAAEGWARAGIPMRAAAPTWRAANVMRAEGLPAQSIASLLIELDRDGLGERLVRGSVLLIDEAGMVDSATLARLIAHAEKANAKLVLVGDPEQLSEIEAGGLFRAIAERTNPIHLDQVIRHRHEVEREGAKRIREGEGPEALRLYRQEGRITVAPDADSRREVMVDDWHRSFAAGEDAVMVAKRNMEVGYLNELARQKLRDAGSLGPKEIEVGGQPFAAGDQVITRVNNRRIGVFNRERWKVVEVDPEAHRATLRGVDQDRTVTLGIDYLARLNSRSDAPALQHAYAITTYSAQGTTVDRAFLAADPSMDKQELYVAASRSREETQIYATPEIQAHAAREEIAPAEHQDRGALAHIAEASARDRAQRAAHEVAQLEALPDEELRRRQRELRALVEDERRRAELIERIEAERDRLADLAATRERIGELPRRERKPALGRIEDEERVVRLKVGSNEEALRRLLPRNDVARHELAAVNEVLEAREWLAETALRLAPRGHEHELTRSAGRGI
ncbi:MAG TPA: MobF family relaxase [Solirubrobacterales bacterium]|nr:MobF family relaxase [Solirubrobacterales bacterium]